MTVTLNKILELLISTDRDLEPWVCDTICDAVQASSSPSSPYWQLLRNFISVPVHNVRLQLRIMKLTIENDTSSCVEIVPAVFNHIRTFPIEVLNICCVYMMERFERSIINDYKPMIMDAVKLCLASPNMSMKKEASSFMSKWCSSFSTTPLEDLKLFDDHYFIINVLSFMYDFECKESAVDLYSRSELPTSLLTEENTSLCSIRVHFILQNTSEGSLLPDLNFRGTGKYWQLFFGHLFSQSIAKKNDCYKEILKRICANHNIEILSVFSKNLLAHKSSLGICEEMSSLILEQFTEHPLLQKTMDIIFDDCSNLQQQRSAHSLLSNIIDFNLLIGIVHVSNVCHHHVKCDITNFECFMSTFLTFMSECSTDSLSLLSSTLHKLINLQEFASTCASLNFQFNSSLVSKLIHGESRVQEIVLEQINLFSAAIVEPKVIETIMELFFNTGDYYVKSSCLSVLSKVDYNRLPQDLLVEKSRLVLLNCMIDSTEFDDSMVAIALFKFFQTHYNLISELISQNIQCLQNLRGSKKTCSSSEVYCTKSVDVDEVIDEICNNDNCSDVTLVNAYKDKVTNQTELPQDERFVTGIFRLVVSHKCDIERLKASIDLISLIIKNYVSVPLKSTLFEFLESNFFSMVESFNSPFLSESICELNSVLEGYRIFPELQPSQNLNIETVLSLLESTPDPNIVIDCY